MSDPHVPQPPTIDDEQLQACRESGDFCPILFEWYKFVAELSNFVSRCRSDCPDVRTIPALHYAVLVGLLNRCSRLMLAIIALSHKGLFGETTAILDRCIFESVVKLRWLCARGDPGSFECLVFDGLKSDVEFKEIILNAVAARGGQALIIEERMLRSIENYLASASTTDTIVAASPRLPRLSEMIRDVGYGRLLYVVGQRIGSHHVHGTWPSLRHDYLEEREGVLQPRDHDCPTHANQYVFGMHLALDAMHAFVEFVLQGGSRASLLDCFASVRGEVNKLNTEVVGEDFDPFASA